MGVTSNSVNAASRFSKRHFLQISAVGAIAALAACSPAAPSSPTAAPAAPTTAPAATSAPAPTTAAAPTAAPKPAAGATSTTAAAAAPATSGGAAGGTLNYAEAGDFNDFNPWGFGAVNFEVYDQVFSRLLWKDGQGKEHPDLADSWEMASDNQSFTVKLHQGAKWHDGQDVTAQDFVTMFGYLKDDVVGKYSGAKKVAGLMGPIKDVQAADPLTLKLSFSQPVPYITDVLDYWFAIRVTDKNDPQFLKSLPSGTGPFKMTQWVPSQFAKFEKFAGYYGSGEPKLDGIVFKRLTQAETLTANLKSGAVDDILVTSLADVGPLQSDSNYVVTPNENSGSIFNIVVNVTKPPFDKKEVRQALSYSLNRVGMASSAFFGVSKPITSAFYSPSSLAYSENLVMAHPFDLDKAKSLLDQAGVSGLKMTINGTPAWPQMKLFSLIWQADLAKIGVQLTVNEVENAKFYDIGGAADLRGFEVHPWLNGRTTRDPAVFFATQGNYRGGKLNPYGYKNDQLEQLVSQGAVETDPAKRKQIYQQLNQLIIDECFMIQVATNPRIWASTNKLKDVDIDLNGNLFLARASLAK
jgi:peptide/nickel transport system substrate-binding protein